MSKMTLRCFTVLIAAVTLTLTSQAQRSDLANTGNELAAFYASGELVYENGYEYVGSWEGAGVDVEFYFYSSTTADPRLKEPVITEIRQPLTVIRSVTGPKYYGWVQEGNLFRHTYTLGFTFAGNPADWEIRGDYNIAFWIDGQYQSFNVELIQDVLNGR